jgi:DNA-binding NarL/FixJ family response regulator
MRVLLADRKAKIRRAVKLLVEQDFGMTVVGEIAIVEGLRTEIREARPDLLLLEWELLGRNPSTALRTIKAEFPRLVVLAISGRPEARGAALEAGADLFVSKVDSPQRLAAALSSIESTRPREKGESG